MIDIIAGLIPGGSLAAIGAAILAFFGLIFKFRHDAKKQVRAEIEAQAATEQLEMHREATDIERRVADLSDAEVKAKLMARAKK